MSVLEKWALRKLIYLQSQPALLMCAQIASLKLFLSGSVHRNK